MMRCKSRHRLIGFSQGKFEVSRVSLLELKCRASEALLLDDGDAL
jgi:hypothetical protein